MSSHREAPEISKDPVADSTDLYAFVSPDRPDYVTIIANYLPLEGPDGGPNFFEFGDDVLYQIWIDNNGDALPDIVYQFQFTTTITNPNTFLYNTGPIQSLTDAHWNRRQTYSVTQVNLKTNASSQLASGLPCPPCNIGPLSTPNYPALASSAVQALPGGDRVFAGQRAEGFYVDLGAIFDLGVLRPFEQLHTTFGVSGTLGAMAGINSTKALNVHSIALQVKREHLTANGQIPSSSTSPGAVLGIWTSASRTKASVRETNGQVVEAGPWVQVSRLGNPLFNEVLVPMSKKDLWNASAPQNDSQFAAGVSNPELAQLLPVLYPNVFPNLAAYNAGAPNRADLVAILLTGLPAGVVAGFQNSTGPRQADQLRLNVAIPPTPVDNASNLGLVGGDAGGFPNGRRVFDDVVTIELRAIAGATLPLVDPAFKPDGAAGEIAPGLTTGPKDLAADNTEAYLTSFPYLGIPHAGFSTPAS